tara:strand:+ start:233 stop:1507 length:1275 start_codon:yes stop_codon:yes gene_type:complete
MVKKIKSLTLLPIVILIGFTIRLFAIYIYGDSELENEWAIIINNLVNHGAFSLYSFNGNLIPTVFMPPLYIFFLFFLKTITPENIELVSIIFSAQIILSIISIIIFYKINIFFFSKNWSTFSAFLFCIFPLNVYAVTQISSITLQIFLTLLYLYSFFLLYRIKEFLWLKLFYFALVSGLIMLLRGEFFLIFIISVIYLYIIKKIDLKKAFLIFLMSLLVISPYLVRNYLTFDKITLTKSIGYNLWKGNNPYSSVEGSDIYVASLNLNEEFNNYAREINRKISEIPKDEMYDFNYNEIFFNEAANYIKEEPLIFIKQYIKKILSFFYFNLNSNYPNYYNILVFVPVFLTSILSSVGILISIKYFNSKHTYLLLYLSLTILIYSLFFILPRYKLSILPMQIIFMNYLFLKCYEKKFLLKKYFKIKK